MTDDPTTPPPRSPDFGDAVMRHALDLWILPEMRRRGLGDAVPIQAQILFGADGPPLVRLGEEVRGDLQVTMRQPPPPGTEVNVTSDPESLDALRLYPEDADQGHITIFLHRDKYRLIFDLRRNGGHARDLLGLAEKFLQTAEFATSQGLIGPLIDTLYSCCELLAKARIVRYPGESKKQYHDGIEKKFRAGLAWSNPPDDFARLFDEVNTKRLPARYDACSKVRLDDAKSALEIARREVDTAKALFL